MYSSVDSEPQSGSFLGESTARSSLGGIPAIDTVAGPSKAALIVTLNEVGGIATESGEPQVDSEPSVDTEESVDAEDTVDSEAKV